VLFDHTLQGFQVLTLNLWRLTTSMGLGIDATGLPIATGVIEGACRHLVNDRMAITGARWGLQRAEAILKRRSLKSSGDSEAYWSFYRDQTLKRNHASCYQSFSLQEAA
jgi:hypothetical protein